MDIVDILVIIAVVLILATMIILSVMREHSRGMHHAFSVTVSAEISTLGLQ